MQRDLVANAYPDATSVYVVRARYVGGGAHGSVEDHRNIAVSDLAPSAGRTDAEGMLSLAAMAKATDILTSARAAEPDITRRLKRLAKQHRGELSGPKQRFKTQQDLAGKLQDRARTRITTPTGKEIDKVMAEEAAKVNDALRYWVLVSPDTHKGLATKFEKEMSGLGYEPSHLSDTWFVEKYAEGYYVTFVAKTSDGPQRFAVALQADQSLGTK